MTFKIFGRVIDKTTGSGIPKLSVKAIDSDLLFDDVLGMVTTDAEGKFEILYEKEDFQELFFDKKPDLYIKIFDAEGEEIHTTEDKVRYQSNETEEFNVEIDYSILENRTGFYTVLGLAMINKAFRSKLPENIDAVVQKYKLDGEEMSVIKRLIASPDWLNSIAAQVEERVLDTVVAAGQRSGWMGDRPEIPVFTPH